MAFSSLLSLAFLQAVLYSNAVSAADTESNTISIQFAKPPAVGSTDDYLLPLSIGANSQPIYLTPSTNSDDTFVNSPLVCTPPQGTAALDACVAYRGGVFGPPKSSSWKPGNDKFAWSDSTYVLFADGNQGEDTLTFATKGGNVTVEEFGFGLVDACNMTSAFLGLGQGSTLLAKLVEEGEIDSRSYGLHVGIDIEDHRGVVDPTFDGPGAGGPGGAPEFNSGVGKRDASNATATGVGGHSFPGSLTLGGYDKAKIDNRTSTLRAPIAGDGTLQLEVTNMVLQNQGVVDVLNTTRAVVIDSSTPYMYLPETTATQLSAALGATYSNAGVDYFYANGVDTYLGNITFTLQIAGGGGSISIVVPPSVLYQPYAALRDYVPVANDFYSHYLPIKTFKDSSKQPIVLGRTFLKAAYIFVNHDKNTFELSQVSYTRGPPSIVAISNDPDSGLLLDDGGIGTIGTAETTKYSHSGDGGHPPIAAIAAAVGCGAVMFAAAIVFLLWRRKQSPPQSNLQPIPSSVTVNHYGNEGPSGTQMQNLAYARDVKHPDGPGGEQQWGVWEKDGNGGYYTPHPLAQGGMQYHEMESDFVGVEMGPGQGNPPGWEMPAAPHPAHMQHPAFSGQQQQFPPGHAGPVPEVRYEMM